jgi:hypothetical protein
LGPSGEIRATGAPGPVNPAVWGASATTGRYVLSHRRAGRFSASDKVAARAAATTAFATLFAESADVVGSRRPEDETKREIVVFEANSAEVAAKRDLVGPDVLLEPEILHFPTIALPLDLAVVPPWQAAGAVLAGTGQRLSLTVRGPSGPLFGAEVLLFLRASGTLRNSLTERTDPDGRATFEFSPAWSPAAVLAIPAGNHWTVVVRGPSDGLVIEAPELPETAGTAWWHGVTGLGVAPEAVGEGVTVAVIDTGRGPHPHLDHVIDAGAFIDGRHDAAPGAGDDVDTHGSHVCGTIGSRPGDGFRHAGGIAPATELVCARVFPSPDTGANQGDIAAAIDHVSAELDADLINLSLGAPFPSEIERDAIQDALERGTLCICAAANSSGPVEYPAAFTESVAVSALGLEGWAPPGSLSATRYPENADRYGLDSLFLANFSCFGPQIDCAAPGVGIIATVPERFGLEAPYAAMDGTSMASPVACGFLAAVLSGSPDYLALARDLSRSNRARALLHTSCRDIGLHATYQGKGLTSILSRLRSR